VKLLVFLRKIISCAFLICVSAVLPVSAATVAGSIPSELSSTSEYRLSKYDVLNIVIVGFSDQYFNNTGYDTSDTIGQAKTTSGFNDIVISPDGYVNLPYAGTVKLAGLTVPEATTLLTQKLGEYIRIPSMTVMVKQYGPRKVYVMGEVAKQGIYSLSSEYMNVFAALSSAGGITKRGRPKHIAVVHMVDGKMNMREVNFDRFIEKQDGTQNAVLQDGDMVYVPRSNKIDLGEDIMPLVNMFAVYKTLTN
jgi:polysaccharide export outer membrane protein